MKTDSVDIDITIFRGLDTGDAAVASYVRPDTGERVTFRGATQREVSAKARIHMLQTWLKVRVEDDEP